MTNKHYLGTFQTNTSKAFRKKLLPVSRALTTESMMAVVEFYGGVENRIFTLQQIWPTT